MRIGIIGRQPALLQRAQHTVTARGHEAHPTVYDEDALALIRSRRIDALVIGGRVEAASRVLLLAACAEHGVRPEEVFGPDKLQQALDSLA
jgi:hypothetical protein